MLMTAKQQHAYLSLISVHHETVDALFLSLWQSLKPPRSATFQYFDYNKHSYWNQLTNVLKCICGCRDRNANRWQRWKVKIHGIPFPMTNTDRQTSVPVATSSQQQQRRWSYPNILMLVISVTSEEYWQVTGLNEKVSESIINKLNWQS